MNTQLAITRIHELPDGFTELADEARRDGFEALARMAVNWQTGRNRFDAEGEAMFAAHDGERLVGICGLSADPFVNDANVGRIRHLYVAKDARRAGIGRALVESAVALAFGRFRVLRVLTTDLGASRFYNALGFNAEIDDPTATYVKMV